tara:strand:- start:2168 stop:2704 length:537 start_codon:yes stop_codon:yes gene_type:complete
MFCNACCDVLCKNCSTPDIKDDEIIVYKGSLFLLLVASIFFTWFIFDNQNLLNNSNEVQQSIIVEETNEINQDTKDVIAINTPITISIPVTQKSEPEETTDTNDKKTEEEIKVEKPEPEKPKYEIYTVKEGDSLYAIAMEYIVLGQDIDEYLEKVANLNGINNPNDIQIGQKIRIPTE